MTNPAGNLIAANYPDPNTTAQDFNPSQVTPYSNSDIAKRNTLFGSQLRGPNFQGIFSLLNSVAAAASNETLQVCWQLWGAFTSIRLVYTNPTLVDIVLAKSRVATPVAKNDNGSTLTWLPVTFNGAASVNLPASPTAPSDEVFTQVVSDPVIISNINSLNLLQVRSDFAGNSAGIDLGIGKMTQWNNNIGLSPLGLGAAGLGADGNPFEFRTGASAGVVANDTVAIAMSTNGRDFSPDAVIANYTVPCTTVGTMGGSHLQGNTTFGDNMGFVMRACALKNLQNKNQSANGNPTRIWSPANFSRGGSSSTAGLSNIQKLATAGMLADVMLILSSQGNDGTPTAALMAANQTRVVEMLKIFRDNRIRPIICIAPPVVAYSAAAYALQKTQSDWARNLAQYGLDILDLNQIYRDPNNIQQLLPAYNSDNLHSNDLGQIQSALALAAML